MQRWPKWPPSDWASAIDACPNCGREFLAGRDYPVGARLGQCRWCKARMVIEPPKRTWRTRLVAWWNGS